MKRLHFYLSRHLPDSNPSGYFVKLPALLCVVSKVPVSVHCYSARHKTVFHS
jgi:hypothetical protein